MLKLGEKIISDIYLGDKKIAKVFLGDKLVYQAGKPIFLDYIESDGNCYINTYVFADTTYTFDTTVAFVKKIYNCVPWGVRSSGNYVTENSQCYLNTNTSSNITIQEITLYSTSASLATNWSSGIIPEIYKVYELKGMTVVPTMTTMEYPIILFGLNNIGTINTSVGVCRIYKWTAYSNGVVVLDLRPCLDPKGVVCMYDMVTKKYFYNQGTGTLKAGGRFVESILFDGESYIDTGIIPTDNTGAYIKYTNTGAYLDSVILGYRGEVFSSMRFFLLASYNCSVSIGRGAYAYLKTDGEWGNAQDFSTLNTSTEVWSNYLNSRVVRAKFGDTDITSVEIPEITFTPSGSLFLGAENRNNTDVVNHYKGEIDRCVITEGGTIIQDLRPYVDENGTACFKDIVTGNLFYNQGTGKLEYTE